MCPFLRKIRIYSCLSHCITASSCLMKADRVHHSSLKISFMYSTHKGDMIKRCKPCNYLHGSKEE